MMLNHGKRVLIATLQEDGDKHYCAVVHVGEFIRAERVRQDLTQQQLAERAGVSVRHLSNVENGEGLTVEMLQKLARALGLRKVPMDGSVELSVPEEGPRSATTIADKHNGERAPLLELPDGMQIVEANPSTVLRRVEAYVAAGHGGWDDAVSGEFVQLPTFLFGADDFVVKAVGDSMIDENIHEGDYLIVERRGSGIAAHGELVIAWLNDGLVVKRWYRREGKKFLESANPEMGWSARELRPDDIFEIQAVVRHIVKNAKRIS